MFTALINGEKVRATKNAHHSFNPVCQECSEPVIARCGNEKVWHWAHSAKSACPAGAGETDWHLHWKTLVNVHETEVRTDVWPNNRADICLDLNDTYCVIELQHSSIDSDTIEQREAAYGESMVWVVDVSARQFRIKSPNYFEWKYASDVWYWVKRPVIFDTGSIWFGRDDRSTSGGTGVALARPTDRSSLVQAIHAYQNHLATTAAEKEEQKRMNDIWRRHRENERKCAYHTTGAMGIDLYFDEEVL